MKQTAVEWLIEQIKEYDFADIKDTENYIIKIPACILTEKEEQAKEMDKEQKIEFANNYGFDICGYDYEKAEQYYNETFKTK